MEYEFQEEIQDIEEIEEEIDELEEVVEETLALIEVHEPNDMNQEVDELIDEETSSLLIESLNDSELFEKSDVGEYEYSENEFGKQANGSLLLSDEISRNAYNQRRVGGEFRREDDDGGHLIGHRFCGSSDMENLFPQNRNFNRGAYKSLENEWERLLEEDKKVYVNIETYNGNNVERPDSVMGHYIVEDVNGNRTWNAFSFVNESSETQDKWHEINEEDLE